MIRAMYNLNPVYLCAESVFPPASLQCAACCSLVCVHHITMHPHMSSTSKPPLTLSSTSTCLLHYTHFFTITCLSIIGLTAPQLSVSYPAAAIPCSD